MNSEKLKTFIIYENGIMTGTMHRVIQEHYTNPHKQLLHINHAHWFYYYWFNLRNPSGFNCLTLNTTILKYENAKSFKICFSNNFFKAQVTTIENNVKELENFSLKNITENTIY